MAFITATVSGNTVEFHAAGNEGDLEGSIRVYSDQNYNEGSGGTDPSLPFFVVRRSFIGEAYITESFSLPGRYVVVLTLRNAGEIDYQYFTIIGITPPIISGDKEYVFEFSGQINQNSMMVTAITKIVALLGGKSVYIEGNKIVVVM